MAYISCWLFHGLGCLWNFDLALLHLRLIMFSIITIVIQFLLWNNWLFKRYITLNVAIRVIQEEAGDSGWESLQLLLYQRYSFRYYHFLAKFDERSAITAVQGGSVHHHHYTSCCIRLINFPHILCKLQAILFRNQSLSRGRHFLYLTSIAFNLVALLQVHLLCTWRWTWLCLSILAFSSSSWVWLIPCWAPSLLFCNEQFLMTISVKHLLLECSYPFSDCNITFLILIEFTLTLLLSEWHLWHLKQNNVVLFLSWSPQHSRLDHSVITVD